MSCKAASAIYFEKHYNLPMRRPNGEIFAEFVRDTTWELPADYQHIKSVSPGLEGT